MSVVLEQDFIFAKVRQSMAQVAGTLCKLGVDW